MSYFEQFKVNEILSLERPLVCSGDKIITTAKETIHNLYKIKKRTPEQEDLATWLGRLIDCLERHYLYKVSIEEAVKIGLLT